MPRNGNGNHHTPIFKPSRSITIEEAIGEYLSANAASGVFSSSTARNRGYYLRCLCNWLQTKKVEFPHQITKNHILLYLNDTNVSKNTKRNLLSVLRSFFDWCITEDLILDSPLVTITSPQCYPPDPDFLTDDEVQKFFQSVVATAQPDVVDRNILIAAFLYVLCLRVSEVVGLSIENIDLQENGDYGQIRIHRKGGKEARLPLNEQLRELLDRWLKVRSGISGAEKLPWVFLSRRKGRPVSARQVQTMCRVALQHAALVKKSMGPHLLRHSGASRYIADGMDIRTVQHLLGHSNIVTTSRYIHLLREYDTIKQKLDGVRISVL
jgi:site-specific recombinase XerD